MLDQAEVSINELRLSNKYSQAQKCQSIYMQQCGRAKTLAEEFETLYNRYLEQETQDKVRESLKSGKIVVVGDNQDEEEINQHIREIQANPRLTQEQKQLRAEAEVLCFN